MSGQDGPPPSHDVGRPLWERDRAGWHGAFVVLALLTAVLLMMEDGTGGGRLAVSLGLLAALCGWYALVGPAALRHRNSRQGLVYLAGAGLLTIALFIAMPVGALMLFVLYPHIWAVLPLRRAMLATLVTVGCVSAVMILHLGLGPPSLLAASLQAAGGLVVAVVLGLWITRIIEQSQRRAEIVAELEATRAELASLSHEAGVMAERERLSGEIHDTLTQGFTSIVLLLQAVETQLETDPAAARRHLHRAQQTARENLAEARSLVAALAPPHLQTAPLADALARLVERTGRELDLAADFAVDGAPVPMPARTQVVLLRATQEALTNVGRHAAANRVRVRLGYHDGGVSLDICDDGRGFDASAPPGFGLDGMRRRVRQVGGALRLTSAPGTGTAITIEVPASEASAAQPTGAAGPAEPAGGSSPDRPTSGASPVGPAGPGRTGGASPVRPAGQGRNGGASPVGPAGQGRNGGGG